MVKRLKLHWVRRDVRHVQMRQHFFGGFGVVVGGATDQREAGERHHSVNRHLVVVHEKAVDGRARIQARCKHRQHAQALRFHR